MTTSGLFEWGKDQQKEVISYVRHIVRAAIVSYPRPSPTNGSQQRALTLGLYNDARRRSKFTFSAGEVDGQEDLDAAEGTQELEIVDAEDDLDMAERGDNIEFL